MSCWISVLQLGFHNSLNAESAETFVTYYIAIMLVPNSNKIHILGNAVHHSVQKPPRPNLPLIFPCASLVSRGHARLGTALCGLSAGWLVWVGCWQLHSLAGRLGMGWEGLIIEFLGRRSEI